MRATLAPGVLVEREAELARMAGRLGAARRGEGGVLVIEGEAGIGKTSLVRALRERAAAEGMQVLHARGAQLESAFAFGVLRQALARAVADLDPAARSAVLSGHAEHAAALFDAAAAGATGEAVLQGVYWLVGNLAERGPLVLAVDDAQWADAPSIAALGFLARRTDQLPVVLVVATRPPDLDAQPELARLVSDPAADVVRPRPLGEAAIAALSGSDDGAFVEAAAEATGGNPFLLEQLLGALGERRDAAAVRAVRPRELARAVLAHLSDEGRTLARAAMILGERATVRECLGLVRLADPERAVRELVAAGILTDGARMRFRHPLIAAAVEMSMPEAERTSLHARAAEMLRARGADVERLAIHLLITEPAGDERVVADLEAAAAAARRRGAPDSAAVLLRRALAEPPPPKRRPAVLLALGQALSLAGDRSAVEVLGEAARATGDPQLRADALEAHVWAASPGRVAFSLPELDRAIAELPAGAVELRLRLEAVRIVIASNTATDFGPALARAERLGFFAADGPRHPDLLANAARWRMQSRDSADSCAVLARRAAETAAAADDLNATRVWFPFTCLVLRAAELLDEGIALAEAAQTWARNHGSAACFALAAVWRGHFLQARGDLAEAEADARAATAAVDRSAGWLAHMPFAALTDILLERGDVAAARAAWKAMGLGEAIPPGRPMTVLFFTRGRLRLAEGNAAAALRDLEAADRRVLDVAAPSMNGQDGRLARALAHHAVGDNDRAREVAGEALEIARSWGTPGAIGEALRVSGLVAGDLGRLASAVDALAASPLRAAHARALLDLGAALRRANQRADARAPLREALRRARASGADGIERAAAAELQATGTNVPPRPGSGAAALTPSEARVARMAADGLSNKDIAQALFVTPKTVEMHLSNAYRKLDVTSRRDLPAALGYPG